jgi:hypothetical protein
MTHLIPHFMTHLMTHLLPHHCTSIYCTVMYLLSYSWVCVELCIVCCVCLQESWDYIGSSRLVHDMARKDFTSFDIDQISHFVELSHLGFTNHTAKQSLYYAHLHRDVSWPAHRLLCCMCGHLCCIHRTIYLETWQCLLKATTSVLLKQSVQPSHPPLCSPS